MKQVNNIISIKPLEVDEQTINLLKELLASAEKGELTSLMFVDKYHDQSVGSGWTGEPSKWMIAEFEELKFKFFAESLLTFDDD